MKHSFTDEQLLNLVNNTILDKTEYKIDSFTGGSIQILSTNNNQILKYKLTLFFGYTEGRNSISKSMDISEEVAPIWFEALMLKTKSMQIRNVSFDFSELNYLMTSKEKERSKEKENSNEVLSIEVLSNKSPSSRSRHEVVTKGFIKPTIEEIKAEILSHGYIVDAETFYHYYESNGWHVGSKKMKSWQSALVTWNRKARPNNPKQEKHDRCTKESSRSYIVENEDTF